MEDKKVTNSEPLKLQRTIELREYALAAFYPLTHSGISAHHKRTVDRLPEIAAHPLLNALCDDGYPHESAAKPCCESVARATVTPQLERPQRVERERGFMDGPKPWKKPWDK
jgi:hypothetical protein